MYVVTKFLFLKVLEAMEKCNKTEIPYDVFEYLLVRYLPVYSNIVSVADPSDVYKELQMITDELNDILLTSLEKSELYPNLKQKIRAELERQPCVSIYDKKIILNKLCKYPLSYLREYMLEQYENLMQKPDVSLTGSIISKVSLALQDNVLKSTVCV